MKTIREYLMGSEYAAAYSPERLQEMEQVLVAEQHSEMPWYLKFFVAVGAWLASLFFMGFVGAIVNLLSPNQTLIGVMGCGVLTAAAIIGRNVSSLFVRQCALAFSLAGQGMIYMGFLPHGDSLGLAACLSVVLAVVLYWFYPDFFSRILTCFVALMLIVFWISPLNWGCGDGENKFFRYMLLCIPYWGLLLIMLANWCARGRSFKVLSPLAYAVVLSLSAWAILLSSGLMERHWVDDKDQIAINACRQLLTGRVIATAASLFALVIWSCGGWKVVKAHALPFAGLALALAAMVALKADGILVAILFIVLGFVLQNRPLLGWGLVLLPGFLAHYYYSLSLTLMQKSGVLIGSGLVLLILREVLKRLVFEKEVEVSQ